MTPPSLESGHTGASTVILGPPPEELLELDVLVPPEELLELDVLVPPEEELEELDETSSLQAMPFRVNAAGTSAGGLELPPWNPNVTVPPFAGMVPFQLPAGLDAVTALPVWL